MTDSPIHGDGRTAAIYLIETLQSVEHVAEIMASEQSPGTFVDVPGETDAFRERHAARVKPTSELEIVPGPSLPGSEAAGDADDVSHSRAEVVLLVPLENTGTSLQSLMATVAVTCTNSSHCPGLDLSTSTCPTRSRPRPRPAVLDRGDARTRRHPRPTGRRDDRQIERRPVASGHPGDTRVRKPRATDGDPVAVPGAKFPADAPLAPSREAYVRSATPLHVPTAVATHSPYVQSSLRGHRSDRRKPTAVVLSLTHKFTKFQTDVSDAVEPNLQSEDRGEE